MENNDLQLGSRVQIHESSQFFKNEASNPKLTNGIIYKITNGGNYIYNVNWDNGYSNIYRKQDLFLVNGNTNHKVLKGIYIKENLKCKNISEVLTELYNTPYKTANTTYNYLYNYKTRKKELINQCAAGKMRSFDDLKIICETHIGKKIDDLQLFKELLLFNNTLENIDNNIIKNELYSCSTMERIRYRLLKKEGTNLIVFYERAIKAEKHDSLYSWKDLFKKLNIHNVEDLKNFYLQNLKQ